MKYRVLLLSSIAVLGLRLTALPQAQPQTAPALQEDPAPVFTVPKDYRYSSKGRRDPFVNPVPKLPTKTEAALAKRPPGLKGVLLSEAHIAGVVTSAEPTMTVVVITAPGAKAAYFGHVGDHLYNAVVKNIKLDTVTFVQTADSNGDPQAPREIVRKVRPTGEDK
jgi:hypothetical protein